MAKLFYRLLAVSVLVIQLSCAALSYNAYHLSPEEREFANENWTQITGVTWTRWSNFDNRDQRDFYLEQVLKKDSEIYKKFTVLRSREISAKKQ